MGSLYLEYEAALWRGQRNRDGSMKLRGLAKHLNVIMSLTKTKQAAMIEVLKKRYELVLGRCCVQLPQARRDCAGGPENATTPDCHVLVALVYL